MKKFRIISALIVFLGSIPLLAVLTAGLIADIGGCTLNEGSVNPCVVWGYDWGETLYSWFVLAWFGVLTVPLAFMTFIIWAVVEIIRIIKGYLK